MCVCVFSLLISYLLTLPALLLKAKEGKAAEEALALKKTNLLLQKELEDMKQKLETSSSEGKKLLEEAKADFRAQILQRENEHKERCSAKRF